MCKLLPLALLAVLAGCGTPATQQEVAAMENSFIATDQLAMAYMTLPPCAVPKPTKGVGAICADPAIKIQIKVKEQEAYDAFVTFKSATSHGSSTDAAILEAAIGALLSSVPVPVPVPAATGVPPTPAKAP
jgi:hypothetical protein